MPYMLHIVLTYMYHICQISNAIYVIYIAISVHICTHILHKEHICSHICLHIWHMYDIYWQTCDIWESHVYVTCICYIRFVHGEHIWHVMLYVTYKSHMSCMHDIYVTYDKATYTTLYGIHICDIYVSHMWHACCIYVWHITSMYGMHICNVYVSHICDMYETYMCDI